jgi:hypothetical protein
LFNSSEKGIIHSDLRKEIHSFLNTEIYLCDKKIDLSCKSQEEISNKLKTIF